MTTPQITALPPAPTPQDSPETFNDKAFRVLAAQDVFVGEANALASFANHKAIDAEESAHVADGHRQATQRDRELADIAAENAKTAASGAKSANDSVQSAITMLQGIDTELTEAQDAARQAMGVAQNAIATAEAAGITKYADTYTQMLSKIAASHIVSGDYVKVFVDENKAGAATVYEVVSGAPVFKQWIDRLRADLLDLEESISAQPQWSEVPAHADAAFDAQSQALANRTEVLNRRTEGLLNVRAFIDTPVDGVTSNQAGITAAVSAAYAVGAELEWPAGTYVSDVNIPNFWDVTHSGKGVIKRGSDVYKISPRNAQLNSLYISTGGSDAHDGLTPEFPLASVQSAFDVLEELGDLSGAWRVAIAGGTYSGSKRSASLGRGFVGSSENSAFDKYTKDWRCCINAR